MSQHAQQRHGRKSPRAERKRADRHGVASGDTPSLQVTGQPDLHSVGAHGPMRLQQGRGKDGGRVWEREAEHTWRASSSASIACLAHSSTGSLYSWTFELFFWRIMCGLSVYREREGRKGEEKEEERRNRIRNQQCMGQEQGKGRVGEERASAGRTSAANIVFHALESGLSESLHDSEMCYWDGQCSISSLCLPTALGA
jgi:hypothetical protein